MIIRFDLVGFVVLTSADMEQFMSELRALAAEESPPYLQPMLDLAQQCLDSPGTEIHVLGD